MVILSALHTTGIYIVELHADTYKWFFDEEYFPNQLVTFKPEFEIQSYALPSKGDWQILGTITPDTISFDPAPYLDKHKVV